MGHVVVPPGEDRARYIGACVRRWTVAVQLEDGTFLPECRVQTPRASQRDGLKWPLRFPEAGESATREDLGSAVTVAFVDGNPRRPVVTGCLFPTDAALQVAGEHSVVARHETAAGLVEVASDGLGNLLLKVKGGAEGPASLTIDVEGAPTGEGMLRIRTTGNVVWEHPEGSGVEFRLGSANADEPIVLGEVLRSALDRFLAAFLSHHHMTPKGPSGTPLPPGKTEAEAVRASPVGDSLMLSDWAFTEKLPTGPK